MTSPYEELIGQLGQLNEKLSAPRELLLRLVNADAPPEVLEAQGHLIEALAMIPLPPDHPDYVALVGRMGKTGASIDGAIEAFDLVKQILDSAVSEITLTKDVISSIVMGFQQGSQ